jgi:putative ABC transport system ATP-binding protein
VAGRLRAGLGGSAMTGSMTLRVSKLSKHYGSGEGLVRAVDEVDLEVTGGESVVISGPSGCGKSTLLQLMGGLDLPSVGGVWVGSKRVDRMSERGRARLRRDRVGFVFQEFHLMEELTAVENVELPGLLAGESSRAARARAVQLLEQVGLTDRTRHLPSALSGGQKQRVAIARALMNRPAVLLADEPTGNLDSAAATEILRLFEGLRRGGQTLVVVTHDARTAAIADRMISMRDGTVVDQVSLSGATSTAQEILNAGSVE